MATSIIMLVMLMIFSVVFLVCIVKSKAYDEFVSAIDKDEFSGCQYYGIGFAFTDLIKFDFSQERVQRQRDKVVVLYGRKFSDFYLRVSYAQKFTYTFLLVFLSLFVACLTGGSDGIMLFSCGILMTVITYVYYSNIFDSKLEKLNRQYMRDFPNAISTIALLVNAGMFLRDAWKEVANSGDSPLYKQMQKVTEDMNNGMSESDAIFAFANRCSTKEIRKFSSMIIQAIDKGGKDLTEGLAKQSDALLNAKKQMTLQEGEKASSKLMIPITIMFVAVLVMIMMPIMSNISM